MTADTLRRQWQLLRSIPRAPKKVTVTTLLLDLKSKGFEVTRRTVPGGCRNLTYCTATVACHCLFVQ